MSCTNRLGMKTPAQTFVGAKLLILIKQKKYSIMLITTEIANILVVIVVIKQTK